MNLKTIGMHIRLYRKKKKLRQEALAEMTNLSTNYIGMIERGEKIPSLESFLCIANALEVSADMLLADVLDQGYKIKASLLAEQLEGLNPKDRENIYAVVETMIKRAAEHK